MRFRLNSHVFFQEDPNLVEIVALEIGQSIVFLVQFLELGIKYWTHGILYKFSLQKRPKISKDWESYHNFHLAHQIFVRVVAL